MKRLVANVKVYVDDDARSEEHSYTKHDLGTLDYEIVANAESEKSMAPSADTETILAHEFGHLIASIQRYPEQLLSGFQWVPQQIRVLGEKTAWRIAEKVLPGLNPKAKKEAIGTYLRAMRMEQDS